MSLAADKPPAYLFIDTYGCPITTFKINPGCCAHCEIPHSHLTTLPPHQWRPRSRFRGSTLLPLRPVASRFATLRPPVDDPTFCINPFSLSCSRRSQPTDMSGKYIAQLAPNFERSASNFDSAIYSAEVRPIASQQQHVR
jgi:hypothetical protein